MGARGRLWSGGRRAGSGGKGKAGGGSPRGGPRSRQRLHHPQRFSPPASRLPRAAAATATAERGPIHFSWGGTAIACGRSSGARGQPRPSRAGFFPPGVRRTCCLGLPSPAALEAGDLPGAEPRVCGGRAPWPPLYRARRQGEALAEARAAPSGSRKPDPAPRRGRGNFHSRRYLVTRLRCHPNQSEECELSEC